MPQVLNFGNQQGNNDAENTNLLNKFFYSDASKAAGINGIGPKMLKNCALLLCYPLCLLFTKCFEQCTIPTEWGVHIVIPVHKSGDKNLVNNYRPISLLCNTSKILEKPVYI